MRVVAFFVAIMLFGGMAYADPSALSAEEEAFKSKTLKIKAGMKESQVISILGRPAAILKADDSLIGDMGVTKGFQYFAFKDDPYFNSFIIGIRNGVVKATQMCYDIGSRTECQSVYISIGMKGKKTDIAGG